MELPAAPRVAGGPRLSCVLCESALSAPTVSSVGPHAGVCFRCSSLTPDDRRVLRNLAMTRILRRDITLRGQSATRRPISATACPNPIESGPLGIGRSAPSLRAPTFVSSPPAVFPDVLVQHQTDRGWLCQIEGRQIFIARQEIEPGTSIPRVGERDTVRIASFAADRVRKALRR